MENKSSYKHLTIILAVLLGTIVIAIILLIMLLIPHKSEEPTNTDHTAAIAESIADLPTSTTAVTTSGGKFYTGKPITPTGTDKEGKPITAETPVTEQLPVTDGEAPVTAPPVGSLPGPTGPVSGSVYGDSLGGLQLYMEWSTLTYDEATGSCTLSISVYCDSFSISIGARPANYFTINGKTTEFQSDPVSIPTNEYKARTLLYSTEYTVTKTDRSQAFPVHIEFGWHFQGTYSGEHAEWLTLTTDFAA